MRGLVSLAKTGSHPGGATNQIADTSPHLQSDWLHYQNGAHG